MSIDENWKFSFSDPSLIGCTITVAYLIASGLCILAWNKCNKGANIIESRGWGFLFLVFMLLALNKQLDLHTLVIGVFKTFTKIQLIFSLVFALCACLFLALMFFKFFTKVSTSQRKVLICLGALLTIVVLRFVPYAGIGDLLVSHVMWLDEGILHVHLVEVFELGFLFLICWICAQFLKSTRRENI